MMLVVRIAEKIKKLIMMTPEWFDKIEKFCGENDLNFNSAFDRMIALDMVGDGKFKCQVCGNKFNYSITGHILKLTKKLCNPCYFNVAMNYNSKKIAGVLNAK